MEIELPTSHVDAITILILLAANGFTGDITACASLSGDRDLWSYLVKCPIGLHKHTWLHAACALGHIDRVGFLCDVGARIEAVDQPKATFYRGEGGRHTPLQRAAMCGHAYVIGALLSRGADVLARNPAEMSALDHAVRGGWVAAVRALIDGGAHIDWNVTDLSPLLHLKWAPTAQYVPGRDPCAIVAMLLEAGASSDVRMLAQVTLPRSDAVPVWLLCRLPLVYCVAASCNMEIFRVLLAYGVEIHLHPGTRVTLLCHVVTTGVECDARLAMIELLLDSGLDVNGKSNDAASHTPLWAAVCLGRLQIAALLRARGGVE